LSVSGSTAITPSGATQTVVERRYRLEADRTKDKALLGSNLSVAPVAEIGWGKGFLSPPSTKSVGSFGACPEAAGLAAYLGT
jgi:hypothetical protein